MDNARYDTVEEKNATEESALKVKQYVKKNMLMDLRKCP